MLAELARQFDVHPNQIAQWRTQLLDGASGVFGEAAKTEAAPAVDVKTLHAKIGALTLENDFLSGALGPRPVCWRAQGDDLSHPPPQRRRQAKALGISRGSVYYRPRPTSDADLALMRRIDALHLDHPFAGSRMLRGMLRPKAMRWVGSTWRR